MKILVEEDNKRKFGTKDRKQVREFLKYILPKTFCRMEAPKITLEFECYADLQDFVEMASKVQNSIEKG